MAFLFRRPEQPETNGHEGTQSLSHGLCPLSHVLGRKPVGPVLGCPSQPTWVSGGFPPDGKRGRAPGCPQRSSRAGRQQTRVKPGRHGEGFPGGQSARHGLLRRGVTNTTFRLGTRPNLSTQCRGFARGKLQQHPLLLSVAAWHFTMGLDCSQGHCANQCQPHPGPCRPVSTHSHPILQGKGWCSHSRDEKIEAETAQLSDKSLSPPASGRTGIRGCVSPVWFYTIATTHPVVHTPPSSGNLQHSPRPFSCSAEPD